MPPRLLRSRPLLAKAQMIVRDESGQATWTRVLLDKGAVPVEPPRRGAS